MNNINKYLIKRAFISVSNIDERRKAREANRTARQLERQLGITLARENVPSRDIEVNIPNHLGEFGEYLANKGIDFYDQTQDNARMRRDQDMQKRMDMRDDLARFLSRSHQDLSETQLSMLAQQKIMDSIREDSRFKDFPSRLLPTDAEKARNSARLLSDISQFSSEDDIRNTNRPKVNSTSFDFSESAFGKNPFGSPSSNVESDNIIYEDNFREPEPTPDSSRNTLGALGGAAVGGLGGYGLTSALTKNKLLRTLGTLGGAGIGGYAGNRLMTPKNS